MPVASVFFNLFATGTPGVWQHLAQTVLPEYATNTLWLLVGVGFGVIAVGVSTAWLTSMHEFPGRRAFEWALILPLAMPAYVIAFVYTDLLQFVGPVQTWLRELTGWSKADYWFPDVRSLGGAVAMFIFVLYPYVYLLARGAFLERSASPLEAGRTLGLGNAAVFFRVALPLARPAVVAGTALALMETVADFGTVSYFGVPTFTTGIYQAWFSMGERVVAAQLSAALLGFVVLVLLLERVSRGRKRFHETSQRTRAPSRQRLAGLPAAAATTVCAVPFVLGFLLPAGLLLRMAVGEGDAQLGPRFLQLAANSVTLAALTSALLVVLALLMAYNARLHPGVFSVNLNRVTGLGYAVPGLVIAVGTLIPLAQFDNALDAWMRTSFGISTGLDLDRIAVDGRYLCPRAGLRRAVLLDRTADRRCFPREGAAEHGGCGAQPRLRPARIAVPHTRADHGAGAVYSRAAHLRGGHEGAARDARHETVQSRYTRDPGLYPGARRAADRSFYRGPRDRRGGARPADRDLAQYCPGTPPGRRRTDGARACGRTIRTLK